MGLTSVGELIQMCKCNISRMSEPHMAKVTCFSAVLNGKTKYRRIRQ